MFTHPDITREIARERTIDRVAAGVAAQAVIDAGAARATRRRDRRCARVGVVAAVAVVVALVGPRARHADARTPALGATPPSASVSHPTVAHPAIASLR